MPGLRPQGCAQQPVLTRAEGVGALAFRCVAGMGVPCETSMQGLVLLNHKPPTLNPENFEPTLSQKLEPSTCDA